MGRTKKLRKQIAGLEEQIRRHREKIAAEQAKPAPNPRRLRKWEKDIEILQREIDKLKARLTRKRRKRGG